MCFVQGTGNTFAAAAVYSVAYTLEFDRKRALHGRLHYSVVGNYCHCVLKAAVSASA